MDGCLHLQGCARRHGGGAWFGLPTLVHYSIATRIDCAARIKRGIFRRTFSAASAREIFVAQASLPVGATGRLAWLTKKPAGSPQRVRPMAGKMPAGPTDKMSVLRT